jgi:hypothetical protein
LTVTSPRWCGAPSRRELTPSPFMVSGRDEAARAATPAEALDRMLDWLCADDDAAAVWYLREDWPTRLTLIGRTVRGLVGASRRTAQLFSLEPGAVLYESITACCGAELGLPEIEWAEPRHRNALRMLPRAERNR